jgi:PAS domain S-box-containing protein
MARRRTLIRQIGIAAAMVVAVLIVALVAIPGARSPSIQRLDGVRTVQAHHQGHDLGMVAVGLPGQLEHAGLPADAKIIAQWNVEIPPGVKGPWGVWIERPQYAARLWWNGELVGESGDVDGSSRSEHGILAWLPIEGEGTHILELEVRGDYGKGGVLGRLVHGPFADVQILASRVEAEKIGLVMLLASLALVQLALTSRRKLRRANLFFGLLCLGLALYLLFRTEMITTFVPEALPGIRVRRAATAWVGPLGIGLAATFDRNRVPGWIWALLGVGGALSAVAIIGPASWLAALELVLDVGLVASALGFIAVMVPMAMRGRPGSLILAVATMAPLAYGTISEVLVTNGLAGGGSHLLPTIAMFAIGVTAALMARDAEDGERHDRLVQSSVDAMLCVDASGRITLTNPAAEVLLGKRAIGANFLDWVDSDDQPLVRAHITHSPHRPDRAEFRLRSHEQVVESVGTPIDDSTHLLLLRDVTRRRRLDQGLLQAARMETLAVLVGGIAHDFNNMLGTLLAHVGFLQVVASDNKNITERVHRMETTLERASLLTRRLLALSGGTTAALASTNLARVARGAVELVEPTLPEGVTLTLEVPDGLPPVAASAVDLEHVLVNLLVNARDAVGAEGTIAVIARPFTTESGAHGVILAVEDDGSGVPIDVRDKIFAPFFTTKGPKRGTGLGLAVAVQIMREHHGRIWVEDRTGGGSRFCLALQHTDVLFHDAAPLPAGKRILVVDDEAVIRDTYTQALERAGYEVRSAEDGAVAAAMLREDAPDLLVTDILMPEMNGVELTRLCRVLHPQVPVLVVSAFVPDAIGEGDPMVQKLEKPIRAPHLVATVGRIRRSLERRERGDEDITVTTHMFPSLDGVTWESARWGAPSPPPVGRRGAGSHQTDL